MRYCREFIYITACYSYLEEFDIYDDIQNILVPVANKTFQAYCLSQTVDLL